MARRGTGKSIDVIDGWVQSGFDRFIYHDHDVDQRRFFDTFFTLSSSLLRQHRHAWMQVARCRFQDASSWNL